MQIELKTDQDGMNYIETTTANDTGGTDTTKHSRHTDPKRAFNAAGDDIIGNIVRALRAGKIVTVTVND